MRSSGLRVTSRLPQFVRRLSVNPDNHCCVRMRSQLACLSLSGALRKARPPQNCPSFSERVSTASNARAASWKLVEGSAMIATSPESERGNNRRQLGPDMMRCDQELRLEYVWAKAVTEAAVQAIPRCPRLTRAGFAYLGHGSSLPRDQSV